MALLLPGAGTTQSSAITITVESSDERESDALRPRGRDRYFRVDAWDDRDDFFERWFGNQLAAMREPVLQTMEPTDSRQAYVMRIVFLPSFHPAYAVRIDARTNRPLVRTTLLTGAGGYDPGRIARSQSETIRRDLADTIATLNRAAAIDDLDPHADDDPNGTICADGMVILVELVDRIGYQAFERHQCELSDQLRDVIIAAATISAPLPEHIRGF